MTDNQRDEQAAATILIVDDTPENLRMLSIILKERGYLPRPVLSGAQALQAARNEPPDLILLDVSMPGMNGFEVCERLKADENLKDIPVIFLSALTDAEDKVKAFAVGGEDYVTKPFYLEEVLARVETRLKIRSLGAKLERYASHLEEIVDQRTRELADVNIKLREELNERVIAEAKLRNTLLEKEALMRELFHRTKNNMQIINSMLELESADHGDDTLTAALKSVENKITSMSLVHEMLYESQDLSSIDMKGYIDSLVSFLISSFMVTPDRIRFEIDVDDIRISIESAMTCGLILNELISNAIKFAFPGARSGTITVTSRLFPDGSIEIAVSDDGVGLPASLDLKTHGRIGMQTLFILAEQQLQGTIGFRAGPGLECRIRFREPARESRI
jgi:two-component sensor histidine kinase/CheY-like chemotaxis protein